MSQDLKVGSRVVLTNPDSISIGRGAHKGSIGKVVYIHTDSVGTKRYLTYNPMWDNRKDGYIRGLEYKGAFIVLWEREFEVIK